MHNTLERREGKNDSREDCIGGGLVTRIAKQKTIDIFFDAFESEDAKPERIAEVVADKAEKSTYILSDTVREYQVWKKDA